MSDPPSVSSSEPPFRTPPIEKGPPRPAPTQAYTFREYNPHANVVYIRNSEQANRVLAKFQLQTPIKVFGFDLEWKPTFRKGAQDNRVALVQLANDDCIMLFQITAMREFPSGLVEVLSNPDIVKAGVAIQSDARKLFNDYRVPIRNCVDLSLMARTVDNARWQGRYNSPIGLAHLIESYEYRLLPKGKICRSNWEAALDPNQQEYASNDAHAGYTLYKRLEKMTTLMQTPPEATWYSFSNLAGFICNDDGLPWHPSNPNYDPGPLPPPKVPTEAQLERAERRKQKQKDWLVEQASLPASQLEAGIPQDSQVQLQVEPGSSLSHGVFSRQIVHGPNHNLNDSQPSSMRAGITTLLGSSRVTALPRNQERKFNQSAIHHNTGRDDNHPSPRDQRQIHGPPSHVNTVYGSSSLPPRPPFQHGTSNNGFSRGRGSDGRHEHTGSSGQSRPAQHQHRQGRYPYRRHWPPATTANNSSTPVHSASSDPHRNADGDRSS